MQGALTWFHELALDASWQASSFYSFQLPFLPKVHYLRKNLIIVC